MRSFFATIEFAQILIGGAIATVAALLASFWPASRGHWSALALAIPGLVGGLLFLVVFLGPHTDLPVKLVGSIPILMAISALVLWSRKRKARLRGRLVDAKKA